MGNQGLQLNPDANGRECSSRSGFFFSLLLTTESGRDQRGNDLVIVVVVED